MRPEFCARVIILTIFILFVIPVVSAREDKINIVVSVGSIKPIVDAVAGDNCIVDFLIPETSDPHTYSLTSQDYKKLQAADLIIVADSGNFSIEKQIKDSFKNKTYLDFKNYIQYGAKFHDLEGYGKNFHAYWLYPLNALAIGATVADYLSKKYPAFSDEYINNYLTFRRKVLDAWKFINKTSSGGNCIVTEPGAAYVAEVMKFRVRGSIAVEPEVLAEGKELERIINLMKSEEVKYIVCPEELKGSKVDRVAKELAAAYSCRIVYVKMFSQIPYESLLYYNLACFENYHTISSSHNNILFLAIIVIGIVAIVEAIIIFMIRKK